MYLFTIIFFIMIVMILDLDYIRDRLDRITAFFLCFGLSFISYSYVAGFFFRKTSVALIAFPLFNWFISWAAPLVLSAILTKIWEETWISDNFYYTLIWIV